MMLLLFQQNIYAAITQIIRNKSYGNLVEVYFPLSYLLQFVRCFMNSKTPEAEQTLTIWIDRWWGEWISIWIINLDWVFFSFYWMKPIIVYSSPHMLKTFAKNIKSNSSEFPLWFFVENATNITGNSRIVRTAMTSQSYISTSQQNKCDQVSRTWCQMQFCCFLKVFRRRSGRR